MGHHLVRSTDDMLGLQESNVDPDSIQLDGTDLTYRDMHDRGFRIQVLPLDES